MNEAYVEHEPQKDCTILTSPLQGLLRSWLIRKILIQLSFSKMSTNINSAHDLRAPNLNKYTPSDKAILLYSSCLIWSWQKLFTH